MEKRNLDAELNFIEDQVQKLCGYDDESLRQVLAEAEQEWERQKAADPEAAARFEEEADKSFDVLMAKVNRERERLADKMGKEYIREEEEDEEYSDYFAEKEDDDDLADIQELEETDGVEESEENSVMVPKRIPLGFMEDSLKNEPENTPSEAKSEKLLYQSEQPLKDDDQSEPITEMKSSSDVLKEDFAEQSSKENAIARDSGSSKATKRKFKWSRKAVILAATVAVMVIGGGIVATATTRREYRYELIHEGKTRLIRHNTMITVESGKLEQAYNSIKDELNVPVVILGYMPKEMFLDDMLISKRNAVLKFDYNGKKIYLKVSQYPLEDASDVLVSDRVSSQDVNNEWLDRILVIDKNKLEDGTVEYSMGFHDKEVYYYLSGTVEEEVFVKIIENLYFQ